MGIDKILFIIISASIITTVLLTGDTKFLFTVTFMTVIIIVTSRTIVWFLSYTMDTN